MIAITGATGQLGQHVLENLLKTVPAGQVVAIVRNPAKAESLSQRGIGVRQADYSDEAGWAAHGCASSPGKTGGRRWD